MSLSQDNEPEPETGLATPERAADPAAISREDRHVADLLTPGEGILLPHFIVAGDLERSRVFYSDVLGDGEGGRAVDRPASEFLDHHQRRWRSDGRQARGDPRNAARPEPSQQRPQHRVADIQAVYEEWRSRGAEFITPPKPRE